MVGRQRQRRTLFSTGSRVGRHATKRRTVKKDYHMLTTPKMQLMQELIAGSTREELIWLSGYLAGVVAQGAAPPTAAQMTTMPHAVAQAAATPVSSNAAPEQPVSPLRITIAYGTETGNSKKL